jgi:tetratricopeptide (TPR) repeat protein
MVETLRIGFPSIGSTGAVLAVEWEKLRVPVKIAVEVDAKIRKSVAAAESSSWQAPMMAARYWFDQKTNREEAWKLLEKSIATNRNYANVSRKARVLADEGKLAEAVKAGEEAVALAKADPRKPDTAAFEKTIAEWKSKKK